MIVYKGKRVSLSVRCVSFFGKFFGLMFSQKEKAPVLLFDFKQSVSYGIHSFFVRYDFLAVWLNEKNKVIQIDRVKPWTSYLRPQKKYVRLIEIPINTKHKNLVQMFGFSG